MPAGVTSASTLDASCADFSANDTLKGPCGSLIICCRQTLAPVGLNLLAASWEQQAWNLAQPCSAFRDCILTSWPALLPSQSTLPAAQNEIRVVPSALLHSADFLAPSLLTNARWCCPASRSLPSVVPLP